MLTKELNKIEQLKIALIASMYRITTTTKIEVFFFFLFPEHPFWFVSINYTDRQ